MSNIREKHIVFDISNLLFRTFSKSMSVDPNAAVGFALHNALNTLMKYYNIVKPDKVIMTFDRRSWRLDYTLSESCVSKMVYKGARRAKREQMTPAERRQYEEFKDHVNEFELLMNQTKVITLAADGLEADDLQAGWAQRFHDEADIYIITTDSDMSQLLKYPTVKIISPDTGKYANLEKYDHNAELYLFTKCIRGDATDSVQSAYPRVRQTRINKAFEDEYEYIQVMEHEWTNHDGRKMIVGDLYKENRLLIDLSAQPKEVREIIDETIDEAISAVADRRFRTSTLLRFCGKHELKNIAKTIDRFIPMLN